MGRSCSVRIRGTFQRADQVVHDSESIRTIKFLNLHVKASVVNNTLLEREGWGHKDPFPYILSDQSGGKLPMQGKLPLQKGRC